MNKKKNIVVLLETLHPSILWLFIIFYDKNLTIDYYFKFDDFFFPKKSFLDVVAL